MSSNKSSSFVTTIDLSLAEKLRTDLIEQGFTITQPAHTLFSAQKPGITCTLYTSGKLMVQGKGKDEFITFYLEPSILQTFVYDYPNIDLNPHIGIDEAGKGDFFGPLCIAGVYADEAMIKQLVQKGVKDSKTLSERQLFALKKEIQNLCPHAIVRIFPERYNTLYEQFRNLNRLLAWGHATAIHELYQKTHCRHVTIDQFASDESVVQQAVAKKEIDVELKQRHGGESDPVVAAASILARVAFVDGIAKLSEEVGMELPKGASDKVILAGKQLVSKHGEDVLKRTAKLHFKTYQQVMDRNPSN